MSIIFAPNFVLTESDPGITPDHPIIGYDNVVTVSNLVADTENADYPARNLANPATHLRWRAGNATAQYLTVTIGTPEDIDYVAIARHNLSSAGIAISIEGDDGGGYDEVVPAVFLPNDGPALFRFSTAPFSGIRIKLAAAPDDVAEIAVAYVGKLLALQRRIYVGHTPMPHGRVSTVTNGSSQSGDFLGAIQLTGGRQSTVPLSLYDPDWYRANFDPFVAAVGRTKPFFFGWRPQSYPNEIGYGWLTNDPVPVPTAPSNLISTTLNVGGVV